MNIVFSSYNIKKYEVENKCSIYNLIVNDIEHIVELLKIATGEFEEEKDKELCKFLDTLIKEKGGLRGVLNYLIDEIDENGFFTYLTGSEIKSLLDEQEKELKKRALMSEEEKKRELEIMMIHGLKKLQEQNTGTKSGKK